MAFPITHLLPPSPLLLPAPSRLSAGCARRWTPLRPQHSVQRGQGLLRGCPGAPAVPGGEELGLDSQGGGARASSEPRRLRSIPARPALSAAGSGAPAPSSSHIPERPPSLCGPALPNPAATPSRAEAGAPGPPRSRGRARRHHVTAAAALGGAAISLGGCGSRRASFKPGF